MNMCYNLAMKIANVADLKNRLSEYLARVEKGEEIEVRKRNTPIARLVPIRDRVPNRTHLGCGLNTVTIKSDLTEPVVEEAEWEGLR
jgi:prevent-host-death family protein